MHMSVSVSVMLGKAQCQIKELRERRVPDVEGVFVAAAFNIARDLCPVKFGVVNMVLSGENTLLKTFSKKPVIRIDRAVNMDNI